MTTALAWFCVVAQFMRALFLTSFVSPSDAAGGILLQEWKLTRISMSMNFWQGNEYQYNSTYYSKSNIQRNLEETRTKKIRQ